MLECSGAAGLGSAERALPANVACYHMILHAATAEPELQSCRCPWFARLLTEARQVRAASHADWRLFVMPMYDGVGVAGLTCGNAWYASTAAATFGCRSGADDDPLRDKTSALDESFREAVRAERGVLGRVSLLPKSAFRTFAQGLVKGADCRLCCGCCCTRAGFG